MILLDILKIRFLIKKIRSIFTLLILILQGKISSNISFQAYPYFHNQGKVKIGKNVWLGKDISIKVSHEAELHIEDGVIISDNCRLNVRKNGLIKIGKNTRINNGSILVGSICIQNNVIIAPNVVMISDSHRIQESSRKHDLSIDEADKSLGIRHGTISINEHVFIGVGAIILHDVNIGAKAIVGAGSIILEDQDEFTTVVGPKAKKLIN